MFASCELDGDTYKACITVKDGGPVFKSFYNFETAQEAVKAAEKVINTVGALVQAAFINSQFYEAE